MPIDLQPGKPFFGDMPKLTAPEGLAGMLAAILQNKRLREQQFGENIADTIKNVRQERQGQAYTQQLKDSELLPADSDVGGPFGAKYGHDIAEMLIRKQKEKYDQERDRKIMDPYYKALTTRAERDPYDIPEADLPADEPETMEKGGYLYRKQYYGRYGQYNWVPVSPTNEQDRPMAPSAIAQYLKNLGLTSENIEAHEKHHGKAGGADVPYDQATDIEIETEGGTRSLPKDTFEKIKRALGVSGSTAAPSPTPAASPSVLPSGTPGGTPSPTPMPSPTATPHKKMGTAKGYGRTLTAKEQEALAWARTHSNDPRAAVILQELGLD